MAAGAVHRAQSQDVRLDARPPPARTLPDPSPYVPLDEFVVAWLAVAGVSGGAVAARATSTTRCIVRRSLREVSR